jgi:hypothetical protein
LLIRQESQPKPIREIAWKALLRLCARYRRLARIGKPANVVTGAVARRSGWEVHVLVAGQPPEHRLTQQPRQPVTTIPAGARVGERAGTRVGHTQRVIQPPSMRWPPGADRGLHLKSLCTRRVTGKAFFASLQKFLRPTVIEVPGDPLAAAQLGDAVLAAQPAQDNANLLLRRKLSPGGAADLLHNLFHRLLYRPGSLSHLRSFNGYDGPEILPSSTALFCLIATDVGQRRAIVAVARRLAVVLHRMWVDGSEFRWGKDSSAVPRLPEAAAENAGNPSQGDNALLRQKNVLTGTTGGVSS